MGLTREQLLALASAGRRTEKVPLPGFGEVHVRTITAAERERWEASLDAGKGRPRHLVRAALVAIAACDEAGNPLFDESDVPAVAALPIAVVEPIFDAAVRLNRVSAADVEKLEGESGASRSDGSPTASPSLSAG